MIDRNGSVQPPETVAQDILDRLAELESGPRKWTAVRRDAIAEIKLLRDDVAESTAALSRAVMALMCKVDDINRLREAGDALTEWAQYNHRSDRCTGKFASKCVCCLDEHVKAWQEARCD